MSFLIREAETRMELERITRFRYEIYIEEMGKRMPEANHQLRRLQDPLDEGATHLYVERDGDVVGTLRIIFGEQGIPREYYSWYGLDDFAEFPVSAFSFTGRLMVTPDLRVSRLAIEFAKDAYRRTRSRDIKFDFIHTTPPLVRLFQKLGYRHYKANFVDEHLGPRIPLVYVLDDHQHMKDMGSPFYPISFERPADPAPLAWYRTTLDRQVMALSEKVMQHGLE